MQRKSSESLRVSSTGTSKGSNYSDQRKVTISDPKKDNVPTRRSSKKEEIDLSALSFVSKRKTNNSMQAELVSGLAISKFKPSLVGTKRKHVQLKDEDTAIK